MSGNSATLDIDVVRVDDCLQARLPGLRGPLRIEKISGGQSNPTYFASYDNRRLVLRRRPGGDILPSAHAVDREFRVQAALADTDVPVPRMLFYIDDPQVAGTAFYVMERVDGRIFHDNRLQQAPAAERRAMYRDLAATLARIHGVDIEATGLAGFGRQGGYFARQIARWTRQWELSRVSDLAAIDRLIEWLPRNLPDDDVTTLVHGDFRTGNVIFHPSRPRIVAVLDWELSTLGHPLADLAHSCVYIWMMNAGEFGSGLRDVDLAASGLPSMQEFVDDYARARGREIRLTRFHLAFALFRNAVIFEGIADRARRGNAIGEDAERVGRLAPVLADARSAIDRQPGNCVTKTPQVRKCHDGFRIFPTRQGNDREAAAFHGQPCLAGPARI